MDTGAVELSISVVMGVLFAMLLAYAWVVSKGMRTGQGSYWRIRQACVVALFLGAAAGMAVSLHVAFSASRRSLAVIALLLTLLLLIFGLLLWLRHYDQTTPYEAANLTNLAIAMLGGAAITCGIFVLQFIIAEQSEQRAFKLLLGSTSDLRGFTPPENRNGLPENMDGMTLRGKDLARSNFNATSLEGADLSFANLEGATLECADLTGADLRAATLHWADLRGARLSGANLIDADLSNAMLQGADLTGVQLSPLTDLRGVNTGQLLLDNLEPDLVKSQPKRSQCLPEDEAQVGTLAEHSCFGGEPGSGDREGDCGRVARAEWPPRE